MLRRFSPLMLTLAAGVVASASTLAMAAQEAHEVHEEVGALSDAKQGAVAGITAIVVFLVVFFVLGWKVWPTITKALDERADKIKNEIEAAEMAQVQAKQALEQYEKNLADARAKAQKMLDDAMAQQQVLAADLRAKSEIELNAMRERARKDIEAAKRTALNEIYAEAANIGTEVATRILKREVTPRDQQRMVEESLTKLHGVNRN